MVKMIEFLSIKKVFKGILDDLKKEYELHMLVFNKIESCHIVTGSKISALPHENNQKKGYPPLEGCMKVWFTNLLDEINIICPHMKYEVVDKVEGTIIGSS